MNSKPSVKLILLILLLASLACSLSGVVSPNPQTESDLQTAVANSLAQTAAFQTSVAQAVFGTEQVTWDARETVIIEETVTPATGYPLVSVSQVTNCRSGPGSTYEWLGSLGIGVQVEVFARDPYNTSWFIRNPNNPSDFCWIYGAYATISGDASALPVYTPMPTPTLASTPTPVGDFLVGIKGISNCGTDFQVRFHIDNNGGVAWRSYHIIATDNDTGITWKHISNSFRELNSCSSGLTLADIAPGEAGYVTTGNFSYSLLGHSIFAEIMLCTQDDLAGTCLTHVTSFHSGDLAPP